MDTTIEARFRPLLETISDTGLDREIEAPAALRMDTADYRGKRIDVAWAPFDHVNPSARIVIVGITPGRQQMANALHEYRRHLHTEQDPPAALAAAKVHASFSGPMRTNLVAMLDDIGVAQLLGVASTGALWGSAAHLAHFTSALRYPVLLDGRNYAGTPGMLSVPLLRAQLETHLAAEMRALPDAIYVPLGPKVGEALAWLAPRVGIPDDRILTGLPHPSGASAERVAYFLRRKPRALLSAKTNAERLDAARAALLGKIRILGA